MASQEPDQDEDAVLSYDFSIHELPPIKIYTSRAKAFEDVNKWAKPKGCVFTNGGSKKKHGLRKAIFLCDKNGPKPVKGLQKRKGRVATSRAKERNASTLLFVRRRRTVHGNYVIVNLGRIQMESKQTSAYILTRLLLVQEQSIQFFEDYSERERERRLLSIK